MMTKQVIILVTFHFCLAVGYYEIECGSVPVIMIEQRIFYQPFFSFSFNLNTWSSNLVKFFFFNFYFVIIYSCIFFCKYLIFCQWFILLLFSILLWNNFLQKIYWEITSVFAGPGCSSLAYGAFLELGPFRVHSDGKTLFKNPYAWNLGIHESS